MKKNKIIICLSIFGVILLVCGIVLVCTNTSSNKETILDEKKDDSEKTGILVNCETEKQYSSDKKVYTVSFYEFKYIDSTITDEVLKDYIKFEDANIYQNTKNHDLHDKNLPTKNKYNDDELSKTAYWENGKYYNGIDNYTFDEYIKYIEEKGFKCEEVK